ncbi:MAG: hypothetical protein H6926_07820 [Chromatiales bacterium]|nr:hypothetical protein [Gammaproteobacteria bacterium]MCP5353075.1 hypothetical protein [Chromatiales bacterium]
MQELLPTLHTGDLVLFSGRGMVGRAIRFLTGSHWSHVGMVVRDPEDGRLLVWEATTFSNVADVDTGRIHRGVALVPLDEKIRRYPGDVAVRRLRGEFSVGSGLKRVERMIAILRHAPYRNYILGHLLSYWWPNRSWLGPRAGTFCSELVAVAYQRLGVLSKESVPAVRTVPADFLRMREFRGVLSGPVRVRRDS